MKVDRLKVDENFVWYTEQKSDFSRVVRNPPFGPHLADSTHKPRTRKRTFFAFYTRKVDKYAKIGEIIRPIAPEPYRTLYKKVDHISEIPWQFPWTYNVECAVRPVP